MCARRFESANTSRHRLDRRSFLNASVGGVLVVNSTIVGSIGALLQPKHSQQERPQIPQLNQYSFERLVRTSLEDITFRRGYPSPYDCDEESDISPFQMASAAIERLGEEDVTEVACNAYEWASRYQVSYNEAAQAQGEGFDCNDKARHACETLSHQGIPMYLLSIWPKLPKDRMKHDWHQMAACKLDDQYFFIVDHARHGTFWHGNLEEFMTEYNTNQTVPMSIIPHFGIAEYVEPRFDVVPAKFLMQFAHAQDEEEMKSLGVSPPLPINTQLAKYMQ